MFYVYEHWRPDRDEPFYVGKGRFDRAYRIKRRNRYHGHIVSFLEKAGFSVNIVIIGEFASEEDAFLLEIERIKFWKGQNIKLANVATGGQGGAGFKLSPERVARISESKKGNTYRLGAKLSDETKEKIAASHRGKSLTNSHKEKLSTSLSGENNPFYGKTHSKETRKKVAESNRRRKWTKESKEKLSKTLTGRTYGPRDKKWTLSEETKKKQKEAALRRWAKKREEKCRTDL